MMTARRRPRNWMAACCRTARSPATWATTRGGGVKTGGSALMVGCTVMNNTAPNWGSCGAYLYGGRAFHCTFTGNSGNNGAVGARDGGFIDSCVVTNNAGDGVYFRNGTVRQHPVGPQYRSRDHLLLGRLGPELHLGQQRRQRNCTERRQSGDGAKLHSSTSTHPAVTVAATSPTRTGTTICGYPAISGGAVLSGNITE